MAPPGVSIIICCYNSALRLPETIKHIGQQNVSNILWELILVNNCSSDHTEAVAKEECLNCGLNEEVFKVVNQPVPGLSAARELGINTAKYEYILFCDDDNWLEKNYLNSAYQIIHHNPAIGALGGYGTPRCETEAPVWFKEIEGAYAVGKQNPTEGDVSEKKGFVFGAGMVMRKTAYERIIQSGFTSLLSDRKGKALTAGGDVELCFALRMAGFLIWYSEKLKYTHFIPSERLTLDYLKKLFRGIGNAQAYLALYADFLNPVNAKPVKYFWMKNLLKQVRSLILTIIQRWTRKQNTWQNVSYYSSVEYLKTLLKERSTYYKKYIIVQDFKNRLQNINK